MCLWKIHWTLDHLVTFIMHSQATSILLLRSPMGQWVIKSYGSTCIGIFMQCALAQVTSMAVSRHNGSCHRISSHIDDLVQDCSISIANALEILQSYTEPSIWYIMGLCKTGMTPVQIVTFLCTHDLPWVCARPTELIICNIFMFLYSELTNVNCIQIMIVIWAS